MEISKGKVRHMQALSNRNGVIAAAAMDQRGSLQKSIAAAKGVSVSNQSLQRSDRAGRGNRRDRVSVCNKNTYGILTRIAGTGSLLRPHV